jgi:hypothetical protein
MAGHDGPFLRQCRPAAGIRRGTTIRPRRVGSPGLIRRQGAAARPDLRAARRTGLHRPQRGCGSCWWPRPPGIRSSGEVVLIQISKVAASVDTAVVQFPLMVAQPLLAGKFSTAPHRRLNGPAGNPVKAAAYYAVLCRIVTGIGLGCRSAASARAVGCVRGTGGGAGSAGRGCGPGEGRSAVAGGHRG